MVASTFLLVRAACHEGYKSCFFRTVAADGSLVVDAEQLMTPEEMYGAPKVAR